MLLLQSDEHCPLTYLNLDPFLACCANVLCSSCFVHIVHLLHAVVSQGVNMTSHESKEYRGQHTLSTLVRVCERRRDVPWG